MRAIDNLDLFTNGVTITVEYNSEYYDKTMTCSNGTTTYTATTTSSGSTTFLVMESGTWTITCDGDSTSITVTTGHTLSMIPDGKTVLPTDDIQIWLACAGIADKSYTTLAEVLADTTTLAALIASENAVDYMVRSTTWAVAQALVPTMTSATTPSGVVSASSEWNATYAAWKAFDNNMSTNWYMGASDSDRYIRYTFPTNNAPAKAVIKYTIITSNGYPLSAITVKVQDASGNNDLGQFVTDAKSGETSTDYTKEVALDSSNAYTGYQLKMSSVTSKADGALLKTGISWKEIQFYSPAICDNATAMSYIGLNNYCANTLLADSTWCNAICNSEYFESVLNVKVPTMTSNTTPEGVCASVNGLGTGSAYNVFDRNSSTYAQPNQYPCIIGYTFTATKKIYMAVAEFEAGRTPGNFKIQYAESSSLTPGTDIKTVSSPSLITKVIFDSAVEKSSFCFNSSSNGTQGWLRVKNLQFYGREDV